MRSETQAEQLWLQIQAPKKFKISRVLCNIRTRYRHNDIMCKYVHLYITKGYRISIKIFRCVSDSLV